MNAVFVDTSAIYALLVPEDASHAPCREALLMLQEKRARLVTSSFVVQEIVALLQARIGLMAVHSFYDGIYPALEVVWIDEELHARARAELLASGRRGVSLTDWSSFEVMRSRALATAFAVDAHFCERGFDVVPSQSG